VNLLGTALVLEVFGEVISVGGAGVFIASMAAFTIPRLPAEVEQQLASNPTNELLSLPFLNSQAAQNSLAAYSISKRANQLRVQAMAPLWGDRGARVNSISPGIISTPMGQQELADPNRGKALRNYIAASAANRFGTPEDIAVTTGFLLSQEASFITGTDILVDGGVIAALRVGRINTRG
jgi:NAD(P)-dependent dehydrogenase (short-subunit alcohol dehydrogenase family)